MLWSMEFQRVEHDRVTELNRNQLHLINFIKLIDFNIIIIRIEHFLILWRKDVYIYIYIYIYNCK